MERLSIKTPFHAPVYFTERCSSTMDAAKSLLFEVPETGTVVVTDYQEAGRGRGTRRNWFAAPGENLLCTVILQYSDLKIIPKAATLRTGLAAAEAVAGLFPGLESSVTVKWPNDVMTGRKKICGILAESSIAAGYSGIYILMGIGINLNQLNFPPEIRDRAGSVRLAIQEITGSQAPVLNRDELLERLLSGLHTHLSPEMDSQWRTRFEERMYQKGETITFVPGQADSETYVEGLVEGVGTEGELLLKTAAGIERFFTGELQCHYQ